LDYENIREFVGLGPRADTPKPDPIREGNLEKAGELMRWMFGDSRAKIAPAITDSRDIQKLAKALNQKQSLRELRKGQRLAQALESAKPARERALKNMEDAADLASGVLSLLPDVSSEEAEELGGPADRLMRAARAIRLGLTRIQDEQEGVVSDGGK
jgi:hypothetical protein